MKKTALILACALAIPCRASGPKTIDLAIDHSHAQAEVAATFQAREIGLMNRPSMTENHGMIFVFEVEGSHCMWMKNTLLPLSVAFVSAEGYILNIEEMAADTEDSHCAASPARYALEMNKGWFARRHIAAGRHIEGLPPLSR